jgi:cell division protein FtsW (lipid II flippase)
MVSMGGTSIWFTCLAVGMILSVSAGAKSKEVLPAGNRPLAHAS